MDDTLSREEEVFDAARKLNNPAEREAYLERACDDDPNLRERVEALLSVHSHAEELFTECISALRSSADNPESPAEARDLARGFEEEKPGAQIGCYKILQKIGEGGCGAVYMAEQEKPMRRLVALKVIKLGMDTRAVIARFDAERQALAMMDHPNIAKVLDAGATGTGRPYFVMELVRGTGSRLIAIRTIWIRGTGSSCSSRFAMPFSTRTRRGLFIATSNRRTSL